MPQNNLSKHLKWLTTEKPFLPPLISHITYSHDALPTSSETPSQNILTLANQTNDDEPGLLPVIAQVSPTAVPSFVLPCASAGAESIGIHNLSEGEENISDMARLRVIPLGGEPKPVSSGVGQPSSSAARRKEQRVQDRRGEHHDSSRSLGIRKQGGAASGVQKSGRSTAAAVIRQQPIGSIDMEAIDLTGDDDGLSSPASSCVAKGKKRKSNEYEEDLQFFHSSTPIRAMSEIADQDFADIDVVLSAAASPPPPYSTIPERGMELDEYNDAGMEILGTGTFLENQSPARHNRKRKSLSHLTFKDSSPSRKAGNQPPCPLALKNASIIDNTTAKDGRSKSSANVKKTGKITARNAGPWTPVRTNRERAVMDSEDEEFGALDEMDIDMQGQMNTLCTSRQDVKEKAPVSKMISSGSGTVQLSIRSPAKPLRCTSPFVGKNDSIPTPAKSQASPGKPSSSNNAIYMPSQAKSIEKSTLVPSDLSKEKRETIRQVVDAFLASEGGRLQQYLNAANSAWHNARAAFLAHLDEHGIPDVSEKERMERSRSRKDAVEQLISLKTGHDELIAQRQRVKTKIEDDLNIGQFDSADGETLNKLFKSLEAIQGQMFNLLEVAGIQRQNKPAAKARAEGGHDVVVQSTQGSPIRRNPQPQAHGRFDCVQQTQFVKQTQIAKHETWTPTHRIHFAEEQVAASPLPAPKFETRVRRDGDQYQSQKSKAVEPFNRIPETPQRRRPLKHAGLDETREPSGQESFRKLDEFDDLDFDEPRGHVCSAFGFSSKANRNR